MTELTVICQICGSEFTYQTVNTSHRRRQCDACRALKKIEYSKRQNASCYTYKKDDLTELLKKHNIDISEPKSDSHSDLDKTMALVSYECAHGNPISYGEYIAAHPDQRWRENQYKLLKLARQKKKHKTTQDYFGAVNKKTFNDAMQENADELETTGGWKWE